MKPKHRKKTSVREMAIEFLIEQAAHEREVDSWDVDCERTLEFLMGKRRVTPRIISHLSKLTGASREFWNNLRKNRLAT